MLADGEPLPPHTRITYRYIWIVADILAWLRSRGLEQATQPRLVRPSGRGPADSCNLSRPERASARIDRKRDMLAALDRKKGGVR
jgi:hypothetical protein